MWLAHEAQTSVDGVKPLLKRRYWYMLFWASGVHLNGILRSILFLKLLEIGWVESVWRIDRI